MSSLFGRGERCGGSSLASVKEVGCYPFLTLSQDAVYVLG